MQLQFLGATREVTGSCSFIEVGGQRLLVAATIYIAGRLSAHADQSGLQHWYGQFRSRPPVVLVHGEEHSISAFADRLAGEARTVFQPAFGDTLDLAEMKMSAAHGA